MILPMTILSIDVEESSDRRKSAKNRRYSLFCPRPEIVFRVGESTSRHSSGLFFCIYARTRHEEPYDDVCCYAKRNANR